MAVSYDIASVTYKLVANNKKITADIIVSELYKAKRDVIDGLKEWQNRNVVWPNIFLTIPKYEKEVEFCILNNWGLDQKNKTAKSHY